MTKVRKNELPQHLIGNILIYNDKDIRYYGGVPMSFDVYTGCVEYRYIDGKANMIPACTTLKANISNFEELDNIMLDETTMKIIAKYNKEVEVKRLDNTIKEKKDKIKELDDILQDKEGRVKKLKEFIANIYNIELDVDDEDYDWD